MGIIKKIKNKMERSENGSTFKASTMPIKQRIQQIDLNIKEGIKQLNDNKKDSQLLRSECATLEHQSTECLNDILKEILEDINNLEKDFRKLQQNDLNEVAFLKQ